MIDRLLLHEGKPLRLGSRALEILIVLVEATGNTVRRDQILARAWPGTAVDEASVRVQIATFAQGPRRGEPRKSLHHQRAWRSRFHAKVTWYGGARPIGCARISYALPIPRFGCLYRRSVN